MPPPPDSLPTLGDLEVKVLELVWVRGEITAKAAHGELGEARRISLNTVQSTLERLHRKALLERTKRGHAYHYAATVAREVLVAALMNQVMDRLGGDPASSLAAFVEGAERIDETGLDALEAALKSRRERNP